MKNYISFSKSDDYRAKIHSLIPGGCHTYSKGDDQFPLNSPAAIKFGKGSYVWDLDDQKYLDCSMGLTSVSLGHAYEPVVERVIEELSKGVNFQRPSYIELEMAEHFLSLVPQHNMIKFSKNGSTATTAAVKLARAYTQRNLVAFPFNHPFYSYDDWFISSTQCDFGIPDHFKKLSVTYEADNLSSLKELFAKYPGQIACVISEPEKSQGISPDYLSNAISFVQSQGAVYILDEMITGYKTDFPGSIKKFGVSPDLATWGKGIANGFSFCALTGKKDIMELGGIKNIGQEKLFLISTTHGGETVAIAAAMATLKEFKEKSVITHNQKIGQSIIDGVKKIIQKKNLVDFIALQEANWMPAFIFRNKEKNICLGMRTLMMQEMIKRGVLFPGSFVPCFSHAQNDVQYFCQAFEESLNIFELALESGFEKFLIGPPIKPVFRKFL